MAKYVKVSQTNEGTTFGNGGTIIAAANFKPIRVKSISNPVDRGLLIEENIEGYIPTAAYGGALKLGGTLEGNLRPRQMEPLIYSMMGASAATSAGWLTGTVYSLSNPSSFQMKIGENTTAATTDLELTYLGTAVKTFNMTITAKEFVTARFDWFAKNYQAASPFQTVVDGEYLTEDPIVFYNATVQFGGVDNSAKIKNMTINIDRKVDEERYVIGDYTLQEIGINGINEITGDITFTEKEYAQFKNAMFGATTASALGCDDAVGSQDVVVFFTDIATCAAEANKMYIKLGTVKYGSTDTTITGQNEVEKKVAYRAVGAGFAIGVSSS